MYPKRKKPDSRRVQETKQKLQAVMIALLQEKSIEHITVMEITERAQLNRTSFYRYYLDVYDLYDGIADSCAEMFQQVIPYLLMKLLCGEPFSNEDRIYRFLQQNQKLIMNSFLMDSRMFQRIKQTNTGYLKQLLHLTEDDTEINLILEFYLGGQLGLLTYWLQHLDTMSAESFFALMQKMVLNGPMTILREKISPEVINNLQKQEVSFESAEAALLNFLDGTVMKK